MHFVFVMDPVSTVIVDEDTTFALMLAAQERGHRVSHCLVQDVTLVDGGVRAKLRDATCARDPGAPVRLGDAIWTDLRDVDAVWIRKDPPFDQPYLWLTLLLDRVAADTLVVNAPEGLRRANEKLYACHFPDVQPKTAVMADKAEIRRFVEGLGGRAVIKPIDGHGGEGVFALRADDPNFNGLVEAVTKVGKRAAMVQEFLPAVVEGDKRILLVDGEPLGGILRVPQKGDVRSNIHVGGSVVATELTEGDLKIIDAVKAKLIEDGLFFVGLDVIGERLTEVNVTSPTGIQQMSRLSGEALEDRTIAALEAKVRAR